MRQSSMTASNDFQRPLCVDPHNFAGHLRKSKSPSALAVSTPAAGAAATTSSHRSEVGCSRNAVLGLSEASVASRRISQPAARAQLAVTTRSGRKSQSVLDSARTRHSGLAKKAKLAHLLGLNGQNKSRKRSNKPRLEEKATSQFCGDESLVEEPPSRDRRRVRVPAEGVFGMDGVAGVDGVVAVDGVVGVAPDGGKAAATLGHEEVSGNMIKVTRSGRHSALVLEWWRNQRLPHAPDGGVAVSSEPPADVKTPRSCAVAKAVVFDGADVSDGEDVPWTKPQLHSLRVAQIDTVPSAIDFWGDVSSKVDGRGPQQCQQKWFELFSVPKPRRGKASSRCNSSPETKTPIAASTFRPSLENVEPADSSPLLTEGVPRRADGDDLFQSTPMRGRSRPGVQLCDDVFEVNTPRTPAGPGAPFVDASAGENASGDGRSDYNRGVSRTYVQALSKKMRKAQGASQMCGSRVVLQKKVETKQPSGAGRKIHVAAASRGRFLKASMGASGAVRVESTGIGDSVDEVSSSDDSENDAE